MTDKRKSALLRHTFRRRAHSVDMMEPPVTKQTYITMLNSCRLCHRGVSLCVELPARHTGKYRMQIIDTGRMLLPGVTTPRSRGGSGGGSTPKTNGGSTPKANGGSTPTADTKAAASAPSPKTTTSASMAAKKSPSTATSTTSSSTSTSNSSSGSGGGVERTSTASVLQRLREKQDASKKRKSPTLDQQQQQVLYLWCGLLTHERLLEVCVKYALTTL